MSRTTQETTMFKPVPETKSVAETIREVADALKEKGYNPIDQLAGYLLSGDPAYVTSYKDARLKIRHFERYELIEALLQNYLEDTDR
ncbi:IreB family regulatory phosphoprotein [Acidaminococcus sp.]|uniref:IreB family regulatory phosphoprotein n=1 Tax=Acidaminococcus sp. TaxID=1872103 RepID=UPI003D7DAAE5